MFIFCLYYCAPHRLAGLLFTSACSCGGGGGYGRGATYRCPILSFPTRFFVVGVFRVFVTGTLTSTPLTTSSSSKTSPRPSLPCSSSAPRTCRRWPDRKAAKSLESHYHIYGSFQRLHQDPPPPLLLLWMSADLFCRKQLMLVNLFSLRLLTALSLRYGARLI